MDDHEHDRDQERRPVLIQGEQPIITKKWKCASVIPPHRSTSTAEQVTKPNDAAMIRALRRKRSRLAPTPQSATMDTSIAVCSTELPISTPNTNNAGTCSQSRITIDRWRRRSTCSGSSCPFGSQCFSAIQRPMIQAPGPPVWRPRVRPK
jgi:hypothetical protein